MANQTASSVTALNAANSALNLRITRMVVMLAPEGGTSITTIVDATGANLSIPSDYKAVGYMEKKDGLNVTPKLTTSPSEAFGEVRPVSYYITAVDLSTDFTMKQTSKTTLQEYYAQDLSGVTANATTHEVTFDTPSVPVIRYPRLLIIGQHRDGANAVWVGQWLPRVMVTSVQPMQMNDQNDLTYKVTYEALVDATVGTAQRPFFSGPGMATLAAEMGF